MHNPQQLPGLPLRRNRGGEADRIAVDPAQDEDGRRSVLVADHVGDRKTGRTEHLDPGDVRCQRADLGLSIQGEATAPSWTCATARPSLARRVRLSRNPNWLARSPCCSFADQSFRPVVNDLDRFSHSADGGAMEVPQDVFAHYAEGREQGRLSRGAGRLEQLRTLELLARWLPAAPAVILDVGGAAGRYALPLAASGYDVHLVDPVPLHISQAQEASRAASRPLISIRTGDARALPFADGSADAVLLLGPLYHLIDREERLQALREAVRVLKPHGVAVVAGISRFASTADGIVAGMLCAPSSPRWSLRMSQLESTSTRRPHPDGSPQPSFTGLRSSGTRWPPSAWHLMGR